MPKKFRISGNMHKSLSDQMVTCIRCGCGVFTVRSPSFQAVGDKGLNISWYGECINCGRQEEFGHERPDCPELSQ